MCMYMLYIYIYTLKKKNSSFIQNIIYVYIKYVKIYKYLNCF